jgi:zinc protease
MCLRALTLVFAILALVTAERPARAGVGRPVHEKRLASGLRVVVCPDPSATDVAVLVRYDTGARDEPGGLEGMAHLVEHLMFMGSRHVGPGGFFRTLEQAGATGINGTTSSDSTMYFETLPPERLEVALWLESDRMGYLLDVASEDSVARARGEVRNEYLERVVQTPLGAIPYFAREALFPRWHPYRHIPLGTPESMDRISLDDVRAFVTTWYGPGNALLVIAGKAEPAAALELADRYFGTLPARPPPARPALPPLPAASTVQIDAAAGVTRADVKVMWITPPFGAPGDAELDLAAAILTGRGAGWLQRVLMGKRSLASRVSAAEESMSLASVFEIDAVVDDGRSMKEVLDVIQQSVGGFDGGVTDEDVRRARSVYLNARLFGLETSFGWASRLASAAQIGPLPATFDGDTGGHAAITTADVRRAVQTWLGRPPALIALSRPRRGTALRGVSLGVVER